MGGTSHQITVSLESPGRLAGATWDGYEQKVRLKQWEVKDSDHREFQPKEESRRVDSPRSISNMIKSLILSVCLIPAVWWEIAYIGIFPGELNHLSVIQ